MRDHTGKRCMSNEALGCHLDCLASVRVPLIRNARIDFRIDQL
jgi:hypothetical protein